ncbi:MAG: CxxxxCH/CxxCH domain-containing protein, partial [Myxococcales bacterium]|nr:CxxxxCH/CxxCH domain-containing protein [Myxococcales bacterium]
MVLLFGLGAMAAWAAGCGEKAPESPREGGCRSCHGDLKSPAPPKALDGSEDPSSPGVGAHRAHLFGIGLSKPVACTECHIEPETVDAPGHIDTDPPAELTWGPLATALGQAPEWDRATLTCVNTYCHGATLSGGNMKTPAWTDTTGDATECGACHGDPPPDPHPNSQLCQ